MDPRAPTPFTPRPDSGGARADYVRAQGKADEATHPVANTDESEDDDASDAGWLVAAIILVPILTGLGALIVIGFAKVLS